MRFRGFIYILFMMIGCNHYVMAESLTKYPASGSYYGYTNSDLIGSYKVSGAIKNEKLNFEFHAGGKKNATLKGRFYLNSDTCFQGTLVKNKGKEKISAVSLVNCGYNSESKKLAGALVLKSASQNARKAMASLTSSTPTQSLAVSPAKTTCDPAYMQQVISSATYNSIFPLTVANDPTIASDAQVTADAKICYANRTTAYSYDAFISAWKDYISKSGTMMACSGNLQTDQVELASFFASVVQETGLNEGAWYYSHTSNPIPMYRLGLCKNIEDNCPNTYVNYPDAADVPACSTACQTLSSGETYDTCSKDYNCLYYPQSGANYCGRGPVQISYNGLYGEFSEFAYGDRATLLKKPENVGTDTALIYLSSLWWWGNADVGKPSAHQIISGEWVPNADDTAKNRGNNFATTILAVNGAVECGKTTPVVQATQRATNFAGILGLMGLDINKIGSIGVSDCSHSTPW